MAIFSDLSSFLDYHQAKSFGIQPVFVMNGNQQTNNNQLDVRQIWLDQCKEITDKMFVAINEVNDNHQINLESIDELFVTDILTESLKSLFDDVKTFGLELGRLCINDKPKNIDKYFAIHFKNLEERFVSLQEHINSCGNLLIAWTDFLDRLYEHFGKDGYDKLSEIASERDSIGIEDYESVLPKSVFINIKSEFDEIYVVLFGQLCDLYDQNQHVYTEVRDLMYELWEDIRSGVTIHDELNLKLSTFIELFLHAEQQSNHLRSRIQANTDKLKKGLERQLKIAGSTIRVQSLTEKLQELESLLEKGKISTDEHKILRANLLSGS